MLNLTIKDKEEINTILYEMQDFIKYPMVLNEDIFEDCMIACFGFSPDIDWDIGASKGVIIPKNANWVIKIPFNTTSFDCGEYPFENACLYLEGCAGAEDWNYCETEYILYNKAKEKGIESFFAEIIKYCFVHNYPIYVQEKVPYLADKDNKDRNTTIESKKRIQQLCNRIETGCFNPKWINVVCNKYGELETIKLLKWISENQISDLHSSNIGYLEDGAPVILDYSSWREL